MNPCSTAKLHWASHRVQASAGQHAFSAAEYACLFTHGRM